MLRLTQRTAAQRFLALGRRGLSTAAGEENDSEEFPFDPAWIDDREGRVSNKSGDSAIVAAVFGSTGFAGRYVVNQLARLGSQIILPYRGEEKAYRHMKVMGDLGQIVPYECDLTQPSQIEEACSRANVVINLVGKRWDTRNYTMDQANHLFPKTIAEVAKACGVPQFIHVGALESAERSPSEFARTKWAGEQAVREIFPEAAILRPASLYGFEDRLLNRWAGITRYWPVTPVLKGYDRLEGPLNVADFARAVVTAVKDPWVSDGATFDLAGPALRTSELLAALEDALVNHKRRLPVSVGTAKAVATLLGQLRAPRFTADEVVSLTRDNVPSGENKTIQDLDIEPTDIRKGMVRYIRHYRMPNFINIIEY